MVSTRDLIQMLRIEEPGGSDMAEKSKSVKFCPGDHENTM
jgi:hypothetical protein